jgi:4-alpha-glucanotransferase
LKINVSIALWAHKAIEEILIFNEISNLHSTYNSKDILGFFRIWEIPTSAITGIFGRFNPALPVWRSELEALGFWDTDRLSKPFIRSHLLERYFHNYDIIDKFFERVGANSFRFKPEYASEKQIAAALPAKLVPPHNAREEDVKKILIHNAQLDSDKAHLFMLVQNVVMLQDPDDSNKFYPRIDMMKTTSYAELNPWQKDALKNLYVEYPSIYNDKMLIK